MSRIKTQIRITERLKLNLIGYAARRGVSMQYILESIIENYAAGAPQKRERPLAATEYIRPRVDSEVLAQAVRRSRIEGVTISAVVREAIAAMVAGDAPR